MNEYYGSKESKRLQRISGFEVTELNDTSYPIGFIKAKGMLIEYATKTNYNRGKLTLKKDQKFIVCDERYKDMEAFEYEGNKYYAGVESYDKGLDQNEYYVIYKELPNIYEDDTFKWRDNTKYGAKETAIVSGMFEFHIIVKNDGDAYIQVKYIKCENKHRNKVTIADLTVYNAKNEVILEAIKEWKQNFMEELKSA